jgi:hypothetical protein
MVRLPDRSEPTIQIEHHKTGAIVNHPLEEKLEDGSVVKFYADAEAVLSQLSRRGLPMILHEIEEGKAKPYSFFGAAEDRPTNAQGDRVASRVHAGHLPTRQND